jgi:hypothetical protein
VQEAACFALDDPLPFLLMGLADCRELSRWIRRQMNTRKEELPNRSEAVAPLDSVAPSD